MRDIPGGVFDKGRTWLYTLLIVLFRMLTAAVLGSGKARQDTNTQRMVLAEEKNEVTRSFGDKI